MAAQVVAEGVESDAQLRVLDTLDCDAAQGFFWSAAVPASDFESAYLGSTLCTPGVEVHHSKPGG